MKESDQHHPRHEREMTYHEIKKLSGFVDFVARLPITTEDQRKTARQIKNLLQNFEETHGLWKWNVCLDIFDYDVQGRDGEGNYWRKWWVFYENGRLEIEACTFHSDDDRYPNEEFFTYDGYAVPGEEMSPKNLGHLDEFIQDARNYKTYITESLRDIEIDIQLWERK